MPKFSEIITDPEERAEIKRFKDMFEAIEVKIWDKGKLIFHWQDKGISEDLRAKINRYYQKGGVK